MHSAATDIISQVAREKLSSRDMLDLRDERMFHQPEWPRLRAVYQQELLGMLRGAERAWLACGAIIRTHTVDGKCFAASLPDRAEDCKIEASGYRWAADLTRTW
jgi:hypothetical protein